jgi:hypothetical protein
MTADQLHLNRLKRLEKLRAIARHNALAEAGRAEARLASLEGLGQRTATLVAQYAARTDSECGADLMRLRVYLGELQRVVVANGIDVTRARAEADARASEAANAERRRAAVEEYANAAQQRIARRAANANVPLGARKHRSA